AVNKALELMVNSEYRLLLSEDGYGYFKVPQMTERIHEKSGLMYHELSDGVFWSPQFEHYPGCVVLAQLRNHISIFAPDEAYPGEEEYVAAVPYEDIRLVKTYKKFVTEEGYLVYPAHTPENMAIRSALRQSFNEQKPEVLLETAFARVDKRLAGQVLQEIVDAGSNEPLAAYTTREGDVWRVKIVEVCRPLSQSKWGMPDDQGEVASGTPA
ncbi:MAG TPA: hypothetical protein VF803_01365, partial [Candidatus Paceibacterota bacterium]